MSNLRICVDLSRSPTWHTLTSSPIVVVMLLSHPGLSVNVGDPHLALLVEPPVEGHGVLGQLLVLAGVEEPLKVHHRVGPEVQF